MKRLLLLSLLLGATRAAFAVTCGGFSIVTADHIVVKYSAPVATGATRSTPVVSMSGTEITVTRTLSGGSATDVSCADDTIDLGYLGAGRFNVTWNDNVNLTTRRSSKMVTAAIRPRSVFRRSGLTISGHTRSRSPTCRRQQHRGFRCAAVFDHLSR
jgi:hypothetical protein